MYIAFHESYAHPVPEGHRFPMKKYTEVFKELASLDKVNYNRLISPELCDWDTIKLVHEDDYIRSLKNKSLSRSDARRIGFNLDEEIIIRERHIMQGTVELALRAINEGAWGFNIAGGTHHAFSNKGEGFCIFNDFAIAAQVLLKEGHCNKILIIDGDVHQGNGTAEIFRENDQVFTFSMHGKNNFPFIKEMSDLDIELDDGTQDDEYLELLNQSLDFIQKVFHPDIIFYQCGVDILSSDKMGKLMITSEGCLKRDELVFNYAKSLNTPVVCALGGGYSEDLSIIVNQHLKTFEIAEQIANH